MSEQPEYISGMLHAMWHTFSPSKELANYTGQLLKKSEDEEAPSFLMRSTKEVHIDSLAYHHRMYKEEMDAIEARIDEERQPFTIAKVAARLIELRRVTGDGTIHRRNVLRVAMMPLYEKRFSNVVTTLDLLPDMKERVERTPSRHYLVVDFNENALTENKTTPKVLRDFQAGSAGYIEKGLFTASLTGIGGAEKSGPAPSEPLNLQESA